MGNPEKRNRNLYCQYHRDHGHITFQSNSTPSVMQCRTDTSWGMWYFSLNDSIKAGVFTKRSNLPILSIRMREQRAEDVIRGDKGSLENETYIG